MPQPMNANNGEAPLIQILPEEMVQVHLPPNNENQAPAPTEPQPAPEQIQQIPEQQQAPAQHIQPLQPTGTIPPQIHAAAPTQPSVQHQSNNQGRSKVHVNMTHFNGNMDAAQWWTTFISFITLQRYEEWEAILCFPFYLDGIANQWWHMLDTSVNNSLSHIKTAFLNRFRPLEEDDVGLTNLRQSEHESVTENIHRALSYNKDRSVADKYQGHLRLLFSKSHVT
ncbi:unnamed protein product [Mytilus coruscus]|uniref:Retrotransposon gag domain-containing protein n=1 Tax=Mytilus coruscus TaxID=42192 RepID=A0A6J8DBA0_MYTCO|nr:unnamed protein product [Mytilus coruscus]